jgi:hypothetical protein
MDFGGELDSVPALTQIGDLGGRKMALAGREMKYPSLSLNMKLERPREKPSRSFLGRKDHGETLLLGSDFRSI